MATTRHVIVAGAGIGGLTASLALAERGFYVTLLEQSGQLQEIGAGIQLSPNAMKVLAALGVDGRLQQMAVAPACIEIKTAQGAPLAQIPLGSHARRRYGAPYWTVHRADLQAALLAAVREHSNIALKLGTRFEGAAIHANGVSIAARQGVHAADESGLAMIGADGLWSTLRGQMGQRRAPIFRDRTAWRTILPAEQVPPEFRNHIVHLWLGKDAHLVHYPVRAGGVINIVAIVRDEWAQPGWDTEGARDELLARFASPHWDDAARALLALPTRWSKWALCDLPALRRWTDGPVALLGDAAHPMLPFLAQGAAMAIEDAAVLADCLAAAPDNAEAALRRYESRRWRRTRKVQRAARRNSEIYHMSGFRAAARDLVLRRTPGKMLLRRFDWLYAWRPPPSS
jgi:salicylate hydroxylase